MGDNSMSLHILFAKKIIKKFVVFREGYGRNIQALYGRNRDIVMRGC
jgi:hypothetical protein